MEKASFCSRNEGKSLTLQKTLLHGRISPIFNVIPWALDLMFAHKMVAAEWDLGAHSTKALAPTTLLEKA